MEKFDLENPKDVRPQSRCLLILAVICVLTSMVLALVVIIVIMKLGKTTISVPKEHDIATTTAPSAVTSAGVLYTTVTASSVVTPVTSDNLSSSASTIISSVSTTTVPTTSSKVPVCSNPVIPHMCDDGSCIPLLSMCDGVPDCEDASDEYVNCSCVAGQFRCASGQCVPMDRRCNGIISSSHDCQDESDEWNCPDCNGFQCDSGVCLWGKSKCDGHVNCRDLSDETNCSILRPGNRRCANGLQIRSEYWCDGTDNCFDNSDEINCTCTFGEVPCEGGGRCIPNRWLCDGHIDCPEGTDENNCSSCPLDQFTCGDHSCVNITAVCDGTTDCKDGRDEEGCFDLRESNSTSGILTASYGGNNFTVCSTNWTTDLSNCACKLMGYEEALEAQYVSIADNGDPDSTEQYLGFPDSKDLTCSASILSSAHPIPVCEENVRLVCMPKECGQRQVPVFVPYVLGGHLVPAGKWPWVASISYLGQEICGGVVISDQWVLTARHCLDSHFTGSTHAGKVPWYVEVLLGSPKRDRTSETGLGVRRRADRIILYPVVVQLVNNIHKWDAALVHLQSPVDFSETIQPICLPSPEQDFLPESNCYLAGWGVVNPHLEIAVQDLRDVRMNIWAEEDCKRDTFFMESKVDTNATLCAGSWSPRLAAGCQGDSGSPLMCEDTRGRWTLAGIMSGGVICSESTNIWTGRANRFTKVSSIVGWIKQTLDSYNSENG